MGVTALNEITICDDLAGVLEACEAFLIALMPTAMVHDDACVDGIEDKVEWIWVQNQDWPCWLIVCGLIQQKTSMAPERDEIE